MWDTATKTNWIDVDERLPETNEELTDLEAAFLHHWRVLAPDAEEPEHDACFHPTRRWRADFLWLNRVIVECEGGIWTGGRHVRGKGYRNDIEKYNAAVAQGYRVFRCTAGMLEDDPATFVAQVRAALEGE